MCAVLVVVGGIFKFFNRNADKNAGKAPLVPEVTKDAISKKDKK